MEKFKYGFVLHIDGKIELLIEKMDTDLVLDESLLFADQIDNSDNKFYEWISKSQIAMGQLQFLNADQKAVGLKIPNGLSGLAWMKDDRRWEPISIDIDRYITHEDRIRNSMSSHPVESRGKTPYCFCNDEGIVVEDYFSDDDESIVVISPSGGVILKEFIGIANYSKKDNVLESSQASSRTAGKPCPPSKASVDVSLKITLDNQVREEIKLIFID